MKIDQRMIHVPPAEDAGHLQGCELPTSSEPGCRCVSGIVEPKMRQMGRSVLSEQRISRRGRNPEHRVQALWKLRQDVQSLERKRNLPRLPVLRHRKVRHPALHIDSAESVDFTGPHPGLQGKQEGQGYPLLQLSIAWVPQGLEHVRNVLLGPQMPPGWRLREVFQPLERVMWEPAPIAADVPVQMPDNLELPVRAGRGDFQRLAPPGPIVNGDVSQGPRSEGGSGQPAQTVPLASVGALLLGDVDPVSLNSIQQGCPGGFAYPAVLNVPLQLDRPLDCLGLGAEVLRGLNAPLPNLRSVLVSDLSVRCHWRKFGALSLSESTVWRHSVSRGGLLSVCFC